MYLNYWALVGFILEYCFFEANFRNTKLPFLKSLRHESSKLLVVNKHYEML